MGLLKVENHNLVRHLNRNGFTLIELLVVIAIMGFLCSMAIYSLSAARVKARDVKRQADLQTLQKAVELYVQEYGKPPITYSYGEANIGGWDSSSQGSYMQFLKGTAGTANPNNIEFLKNVPIDPINNGTGDCGGGGLGFQYCYYYYSAPA